MGLGRVMYPETLAQLVSLIIMLWVGRAREAIASKSNVTTMGSLH